MRSKLINLSKDIAERCIECPLCRRECAFLARYGNPKETEDRDLVTYCVGCSRFLGKLTPAAHLLDLFFEPEATLGGRVKPAGPPWTYWNRLSLKRKLKKTMKASLTPERTLPPVPSDR